MWTRKFDPFKFIAPRREFGFGVMFPNRSRSNTRQPSYYGKLTLLDGTIVCLTMFDNHDKHGVLYYSIKIADEERQEASQELPELPEGDDDDGKVSFRG